MTDNLNQFCCSQLFAIYLPTYRSGVERHAYHPSFLLEAATTYVDQYELRFNSSDSHAPLVHCIIISYCADIRICFSASTAGGKAALVYEETKCDNETTATLSIRNMALCYNNESLLVLYYDVKVY